VHRERLLSRKVNVEQLTDIRGVTAKELFEKISQTGADLRLARRIQSAVFRSGVFPSELPEVSSRLLLKIKEITRIASLECIEKAVSPIDGFTRYLFRSEGEGLFESVRIPLVHRPGDEKYIICISSQIGCSVGCAFCATGSMGFIRDLSAGEIVAQVEAVKRDSEYPVGGVVFMGMGEPFLNYENVMKSAQIISSPTGMAVAAKTITVSTSGVVPQIRQFTDEGRPYKLVISLSSADSAQREILIPTEKKWPLSELAESVKYYHDKTGERVTLAWTMISGVNCSENDAVGLSELFSGIPVKLDLIDVNDPSGKMVPPSDEERNLFLDYLRLHLKMPVARRYSGGKDIEAACGMLAGRASQNTKPTEKNSNA